MTTDLEAIGRDLHLALGRRIQTRRRRRRLTRLAAVALSVAAVFSTVAIASGIDGDLGLDPTKWSFLGGGSVDSGRGAYVHATSRQDGSNSTFLVEHDSGLPAYEAFRLHETTLAAADSTSPVPVRVERGDICTAEALTRAEAVALATLRAQFNAGSSADATKAAVDSAVSTAFADAPCKGLEYAGEQARLVYAGRQPASKLMPGARE
jgi:hypothetical protein